MNFKISRSSSIPNYINVTGLLKENQKKAELDKKKDFENSMRKGALRFTEAQAALDLIDHGHGVLEDRDTGIVWYREGDSIFRQEDDGRENILQALSG